MKKVFTFVETKAPGALNQAKIMDSLTLAKANHLNRQIAEFEEALNCFEWKPSEESDPISLNPRLIIEFDNDGREQRKIPMNLSDKMIAFLKGEIIKGRDAALSEFKAL